VPIALDFGADDDQMTVVLYGTGLRNLRSIQSLQVRVADREATIESVSPRPNFPGVDQINVVIPGHMEGLRARLRDSYL